MRGGGIILNRIVYKLINALNYFAMLGLVIMMLVITADVISKYVFNSSIAWAYNLTESFLMVVVIFLGIAYTHYQEDHIRFELIIEKVPNFLNTIINIISHLLMLLLFTLIGYQGYLETVYNWTNNISTGGVLSLPLYLSVMWIPVGSLLIIIISGIKVLENIINLFK